MCGMCKYAPTGRVAIHAVYKYYTNMPCQHIFGLENQSTYLEPCLMAHTHRNLSLHSCQARQLIMQCGQFRFVYIYITL